MRKMVLLVSAVVAAIGIEVAGPLRPSGALAAHQPRHSRTPDGTGLGGLRSERLNPQRIVILVLIFSDVVLALAVWGVAIVVRAAWGTSTIAGVLPTNTIAGVLPVAVWVLLRAFLGVYPGYGLNAVDEVRRQSYATLGALIIISTFLGLRPGQDVSRSVLIAGFLALLIVAPLVRQLVKWSLKKARLWGSWMTTDSR